MALSTSRTVITQSGLTTTQSFNVGGILAGVSNLHTIGYDVVDSNTGTGVTVRSTGNAVFSGVITASKFVGDISEATGAAAGLGTALSQTQTDPHNKIYYTNKVLSISTTTTIDHPATANLAYTQYGDIKIENGHDLIIKDGDDFKYDILGISTTKVADNYFQNGLTIGFGSSVKGDLIGNVTGDVTGNVTGDVTGSGANLTNIPAGQLTGALPAISGANLTGIIAGITMVDQYYLSSTKTANGNSAITLDTDFIRASGNVTGAGHIGTGMTKGSGGIFSFPSTGIYHIHFRAQVMMNSGSTGNRYAQNPIEITTNNSSYTNVSMGLDGVSPISGESFGNPIATFIFDVTDTSTHKCRFKVQSGESNWSAYVGNSSRMDTVVTFTRLGDT